ncbi:MAG: Peptidyl-prolyl cis-trans isomerase [Methanomicrobiales archaeon 53_19]|nr:MAG: Peptidyl-prolyl cis-trans isomerase [Methanocalculus sp. 52_23]KUL05062.1 MAG: Peptidyl-prolyl cis-trans isomerase [Methanomicrobiales archaeon 53_19]
MKETPRFFICLLGLLAASLLIAGCMGSAPTATEGDTVKVHYTGTLSNGTTFDSSAGREPLEFTLGEGQVIPGFEDAVLGMAVGEEKTVTIPVDQAYGSYDEDLILVVPREMVPDEIAVVGISLYQPRGTIISVDDEVVMIDQNHPLAGEDLTFTITLVEIL